MTDVLPNSRLPIPDVMTSLEACDYLRVADGSPNDKATLKRLDRLLAKGVLRAVLISRKRRFTRAECDRFIAAEMASVND